MCSANPILSTLEDCNYDFRAPAATYNVNSVRVSRPNSTSGPLK